MPCVSDCRVEKAGSSQEQIFRSDPVYIKALQIAESSGEGLMYTEWDGAHVETTYRGG